MNEEKEPLPSHLRPGGQRKDGEETRVSYWLTTHRKL
jgi:hypothetical protein